MFSPDQLVVYPAQGVGRIERIEHRNIGGVTAEFYLVRILGNNITLMVPVNSSNSIGLRHLSTPSEGQAVMTSLQDRTTFTGYSGQNWNRRHREYTERLKKGSLADVAYVLKDLILISGEKELSFGERRLLEQSMDLLARELSFVFDQPNENIRADIEMLFADILTKKEKVE